MMKDTTDEGGSVSMSVDCRNIDGIGMSMKRGTRRRLIGPILLDSFSHSPGILFGEDPRHRDLHKFRIADITVSITKGSLLGLDDKMKIIRTIGSEACDIVSFQDIEHLQGNHPLAIWG